MTNTLAKLVKQIPNEYDRYLDTSEQLIIQIPIAKYKDQFSRTIKIKSSQGWADENKSLSSRKPSLAQVGTLQLASGTILMTLIKRPLFHLGALFGSDRSADSGGDGDTHPENKNKKNKK